LNERWSIGFYCDDINDMYALSSVSTFCLPEMK